MTSIGIKVLVTLAALGSVYVFIRDIQHSARRRRLAQWVRDHYPQEWRAIDWATRNLLIAGALARLHRSRAITHPHFVQEYPRVRRWPTDMIVAVGVACASIALAILGGLYLGWVW
jgi:hypothetical protein